MEYLAAQLITSPDGQEFSLLGRAADKKGAAMLAADAYLAYRPAASEQNIAMITEWIATRGNYSFRADRSHRLQLALVPLVGIEDAQEKQVVFTCCPEEDDRLLAEISAALIGDGRHTASREDKERNDACRVPQPNHENKC